MSCKNINVTQERQYAMRRFPWGKPGTAIQFQRRELVAVPVLRRAHRSAFSRESRVCGSDALWHVDGFVRLRSRSQPLLQAFQVEVDYRGNVERQELADDEAADHGEAERLAGVGAFAVTESDGQGAEKGGHGGHHDGAGAQQAALPD